MKYSQLLTKTIKSSKKFDSINATYLIKGGFIDQIMSGVYAFLPLGQKVLHKIETIIKEEMDVIGTELFLPSLSPKSFWEKTRRLESVDILMQAGGANEMSRAKNDGEYILNATHEDVITPIAMKFRESYKDFPFAVYQIQTKYRNEERPKSGLLRCREFRMKDLYSFHTSQEDLNSYYEKAKDAYSKVFARLGIGEDTVIALASGGDFTKEYSHEFQTKCETGEDTIFYDKKTKTAYNKEVTPSKAPIFMQKENKLRAIENVKGEGIIGVAELSKFLKIPIEATTKTILFEDDRGGVVAACVRGDYDVNEYKLKRVHKSKVLKLASEKTVKKVTGAQVGYAGPLNLPKDVKLYFDDSTQGRINFECGANKTNFHVINVNFGRDLKKPKEFVDIKTAKEGDCNPKSGEVYEVFKASEVGNIFPLNTKFTDAFGYKYIDNEGMKSDIYMGSYGIGSSRVMGVIVEKFHDDRGIIWPVQVAPFLAHLIVLGDEDGESLYKKLQQSGIDVLFDDRTNVSAGEKFADADLIGCPFRLVVSAKTKGKIEIKKRNEGDITLVSVQEAEDLLKRQVNV